MKHPVRNTLFTVLALLILGFGIFFVYQIDILGVYQCTSSTANEGQCVYKDKLTLTVGDQWEFLGESSTYSIRYDAGQLKTGSLSFQGDFPMGDADFTDGLPPSTLTFRGIDGDEIWTQR